MGGLTDNTDILKGINQIIAAINALELSASCPAPEVTVTVRPNITVNCSCAGGGNGTTPPIPDDTGETSPDPPGWEQKPVDDDDCKRANISYDAIYQMVEKLDNDDIITKMSVLIATYGFALGLLGVTVEAVTIGGVSLSEALGGSTAVSGYLYTLAKQLLMTGVSLPTILLKLEQNKQDIVCLFYDKITNGGTARSATDDMIQILADAGLGEVDQLALEAMYFGSVSLMLFKTTPALETVLAAYSLEGKTDCGACSNASWALWYGIGTVNYSTPFTLSSVPVSSFHLICMSGELRNCTFTNLSGWNGLSVNDFIAGTGGYGVAPENDVWNSDTPFSTMCCGVWAITSATPFSVSVRIGSEC